MGLWREGPVGLGHRMRWTTPESLHESLPFSRPSERLAITADARLDNREDLIASLNVTDHAISDSTLILLAYDRWGDTCPEKLLGDFAFVIWDGRRQALLCARDPMGVKPFYYHHQPDRFFAFASEIKALLCLAEIPRRLNEERVADYLVPILEDMEATFFRDIVRLPPGHRLLLDSRGLALQRYWSLDPSREMRLDSDEAYAEAFRSLFSDAVRAGLRSAYPVGSLLSGGLDSSSITCTARSLIAKNGGKPLHTFSAIFDDVPECDERQFIKHVVDQGGLDAHYVRADRLSPLTDLDRVLWHEDEPFYAPNLYMHWGLFKSAQEQSVRVLFDGFDGDSTVSHGMATLTELASSGRWIALAAELIGMSRHGRRSGWDGLRSYVIGPMLPDSMRRAWRSLRRRPVERSEGNSTIRSEFADRIGLAERLHYWQGDRRKPAHTAREEHYRRLTWGVIPFALEVVDRAAAAFSIEPRYPFFDRRLVEFCLALPPEQKLHKGWSRVVLRRAMAGTLPAVIQWRGGKTKLGSNFDHGLFTFDRKFLDYIILKFPTVIELYVDIGALRRVYERYLIRPNVSDAMMVWKAATLGLWLGRTGLQPETR